jgi:excisionase family DNA binding protein
MPVQTNHERTLLTTQEASVLALVTPAHLSFLLRQHRIDGIKAGRDWLIYEDSLRAFIRQPRKRGPKGPRIEHRAFPRPLLEA